MDRLPIDEVLPSLLAALDTQISAVVVAPPGAGKTTRVPLALLDAGWRQDGRMIMLEPRRLAARAAAARMAATLGEEVGQTVGYRVRLESRVSARTRIEVVTEGVFTRMLLDDPELHGVAAVLFDEFHERSLDGDLGLALALDSRALNPDLRLLVMSATIDGARVSQLLGDAPVIVSEGRMFPVAVRHVDRDPLRRIEDQVTATVLEAMRVDAGSALVFLPGQGEIARVAEQLAGRVPADVDIAPLYGQLTPAEQDRAIRPAAPGRRKVVLATSIAETSLTIEGVRIVVDSGLRRLPEYDPGTGLTTLVTRPVSQAGAEQRRGRAGRIEPGVCYRLWSAGQTAAMPPYDVPEILAADLSGFALDLAAWGVSDPVTLAFLDPPPAPAWSEAIALLRSLDAIDAAGHITRQGKALSLLPLHPRLAHMVVEGAARQSGLMAAELAVLVGERGLGGNDIDVAHRLDAFRRDRSKRADDASKLAQRWARLAGNDGRDGDPGELLALAYPDRVAQAAGARGRFRLANGRGASLDASEALAAPPYLVVTDVTGSAADGRIRGAARISRETIEALFAASIVDEDILSFDKGSGSLRARRVRRLGALRLAEATVPVPAGEAAAGVLARGAAETGIDRLAWSREQRALRDRSTYLSQILGADWPDLTEAALAASAETWLAPNLTGLTQLSQVDVSVLGAALDGLLDWNRRSEIDRLLPSHFEAPTGNRLPIDYAAENGPALEIRVQELFGLDRHPAVGGGRIPLTLVLLSPAHRPIQTTRDLPGFWRGSWKDVAKDLKGRYPRHPWPDDPLSAPPTHRAKPRGT